MLPRFSFRFPLEFVRLSSGLPRFFLVFFDVLQISFRFPLDFLWVSILFHLCFLGFLQMSTRFPQIFLWASFLQISFRISLEFFPLKLKKLKKLKKQKPQNPGWRSLDGPDPDLAGGQADDQAKGGPGGPKSSFPYCSGGQIEKTQ